MTSTYEMEVFKRLDVEILQENGNKSPLMSKDERPRCDRGIDSSSRSLWFLNLRILSLKESVNVFKFYGGLDGEREGSFAIEMLPRRRYRSDSS